MYKTDMKIERSDIVVLIITLALLCLLVLMLWAVGDGNRGYQPMNKELRDSFSEPGGASGQGGLDEIISTYPEPNPLILEHL